jgi:DNA-binding response OmpR family regulator
MSDRVLVVEDDPKLGAQVVASLAKEGLDVTWVQDGDEAAKLDPSAFDLVVLDLMLPGTYGLDVLKRFRAKSDVPVLILSAREDTTDKVRALKLGADDYVTKPFFPEELVARVQARLRRPVLDRSGVLRITGLVVDPGARTARTDAGEVELTRAEFEILVVLMRRVGSAITRAALVDAALDKDTGGHERTLDVHVSRLRKKLGPVGEQLRTVWGIGYKLVAEPGRDR